MASTYTPIATTTLSSNTASISFSSISNGYTDLILMASARSTFANTSDIMYINVNGGGGTGYSYTRLTGDGSAAASARETGLAYWRIGYSVPAANATSGVFGYDQLQLMNYANTNTYKTALWRNSPAAIEAAAAVCLWQSTSAINRIDVFVGNGSLATGSTFTLYGITAA